MEETFELDGYRVEIKHDPDPMNPVEDHCMLFKFIIFHRRYDFGHKHDFADPAHFIKYMKKHTGDIALPLYMYEHSGITISLGSFSASDPGGWDSGQVGWVWASQEALKENFMVKRVRAYHKARALEVAKAEVQTVDDYLTGQVYGYEVYDADEELVDSCWGYFGSDEGFCRESAVDAVRCAVYQKKKDLEKKVGPYLPGLELAV